MGCHAVPLERKRALGGRRRGRKFTESKVHVLGGGIRRAEKERREVTGKVKGEEEEKRGQRERERQEEGGEGRTMRRPETQGTQGDAAAGSVASSGYSAHRQPAAVE